MFDTLAKAYAEHMLICLAYAGLLSNGLDFGVRKLRGDVSDFKEDMLGTPGTCASRCELRLKCVTTQSTSRVANDLIHHGIISDQTHHQPQKTPWKICHINSSVNPHK